MQTAISIPLYSKSIASKDATSNLQKCLGSMVIDTSCCADPALVVKLNKNKNKVRLVNFLYLSMPGCIKRLQFENNSQTKRQLSVWSKLASYFLYGCIRPWAIG